VTKRYGYRATLTVLAFGGFSHALLQTLVTPALPSIQRDLGASTTAVAWVLTIFLLVGCLAAPIVGRLGDMFGKDRMLQIVVLVVMTGCLIAALSHSLPLLLVGRGLQGVGTSIFALGFAIVRDEFPSDKVGTGLGLLSATWGLGGATGISLSGVIVGRLSYEWMFWISLLIFSITFLGVRRVVPPSPVTSPARIDWIGAGLLGASLTAVLLAVSEALAWGWTSLRLLALLGGGALGFAVWARYELGQRAPLVDLRLARRRTVWPIYLTGALSGIAIYMPFILMPKFVQTPASAGYGFGASPIETSLLLLPWTVVMMAVAPLAGIFARRFGARAPVLAATAVGLIGFVLMAVANDHLWQILIANALMGLAIGLNHAALANLIARAVPQAQTGEANAVGVIVRTAGSAVGAQLAATIISVGAPSSPSAHAYVAAFGAAAVAMALALAAALLIPRPRREHLANEQLFDLPVPLYGRRTLEAKES
jgi:MFS family permease